MLTTVMKYCMAAVMMFFTGPVWSGPISPSVRTEKIRATPVTIYPGFDVRDAAFVACFNRFARTDDALVISHMEAFKGSFRVADLGVARGQVWVQVDREANLGQSLRKNVEGARGIVFIPDRDQVVSKHSNVRRTASQLAEEAKALGVPLIVGLDDRDTWSLANVADIARSGDVLTICASSRLHGSVAEYRAHIEKVIRAAREENPRIKVELAFIATMAVEDRARMFDLAVANIDLADRLAIYCDNNQESLESLTALLARLRPDGA